MLVIVF